MNRKKIFLLDDHPVFRQGLVQLINGEEDMIVCGEADNYYDSTRLVESKSPDMIIADITLRDVSGLELIKYLHDRNIEIPVLVLSMHDEIIYAEKAMKAGASGYIMKHEMTDNVVSAIRQVMNGKIYISESINKLVVQKFFTKNKKKSDMISDILTDREFEILNLIGQGYKRKKIAEKLNLNVNTIGTYRERIKEKIGVESSSELTAKAISWFQNGDLK
jgi:DNA-binding NarL/FixJ family response regulator